MERPLIDPRLCIPRKVSLEDYSILRTLGVGGFGRVRLAKHQKKNQYMAIKILKKADIIERNQVEHILDENSILASIKHPFIVHLEGYSQDARYLYMVMEFVRGGEVFTYLRSVVSFPFAQAQFYAAQVVLMLEYLHSKNIIYRDLKPENLLIDERGYLKLTDFGFAKLCDGRTYTCCGTPEYLAPEIILNQGYGKGVDLWALGVLIYEMLVGIDPFNDEDQAVMYKRILAAKLKFPADCPGAAKSLIKHLLQPDVTKRFGNLKNGMKDIKEHRFFQKFSWDKCYKAELTAPYIPILKGLDDASNFAPCPDSVMKPKPIKADDDPFLNW